MSKKRPFKRPKPTLVQVNQLFTIKEVVFTEIADAIIHCLIILANDNHISGEYDYGSHIKNVINSKKISESEMLPHRYEFKEFAKQQAFERAFLKLSGYHKNKIFKAITGNDFSEREDD